MASITDDIEAQIKVLLDDGFYPYAHETIKPGVRVRNRGEQFFKARHNGTAVVIAVLRKEGYWEEKYGRKNIEVLVCRDRNDVLSWWADYGTVIAHLQPDSETL